MNAQGDAQTGLVLTRNEIWLLLHALAETTAPTLRWDGNDLEPWEVGELQRKLRGALQAEPVDSIEAAVIVPIDSELGAELLGLISAAWRCRRPSISARSWLLAPTGGGGSRSSCPGGRTPAPPPM